MNSFHKHLVSARYVLHMVLSTETTVSKTGKVLAKVTKHLGENYGERRIGIVYRAEAEHHKCINVQQGYKLVD